MTEGMAELWPAAGVRAASGDLELRWIDDAIALELARVAARGVHDPDRMPFGVPWTRGSAEDVARSVLAFQWAARGAVGPRGALRLEYAVLVAGEPVGVQGASGTDWRVLRTVATGSWLGREFHGRGIGTRMRALMLHLLFDGLGAAEVTSGAFADNPASNAVSLRTGYVPDGAERMVREGVLATHNRYVLTRARWDETRTATSALLGAPVELEGVESLRTFLDRSD